VYFGKGDTHRAVAMPTLKAGPWVTGTERVRLSQRDNLTRGRIVRASRPSTSAPDILTISRCLPTVGTVFESALYNPIRLERRRIDVICEEANRTRRKFIAVLSMVFVEVSKVYHIKVVDQ
jgi:hypothetical protein